jgi:hypothetical protein
MNKACTKCGVNKPLTEFFKKMASKDGHRACCKKCNAGYTLKNKDKIAARGKRWRAANADRIRLRKKKYYEDNKGRILAAQAVYREENRHAINEQAREYSRRNRGEIEKRRKQRDTPGKRAQAIERSKKSYESRKHLESFKATKEEYVKRNYTKIKEYKQKWSQSVEGKYCSYKSSAASREISFDLTMEEFNNFWQAPCAYCGDEINTIGLDRIHNQNGYSMNNILSCCQICNQAKNKLSFDNWVGWIDRIARTYFGALKLQESEE